MKPKKQSLDLTPPVSLREQAYRLIRKAILSGELAPDGVITVKQMAAVFDMGRTPVREALQDLERDGFVRVIPFHGAIVRPLTLTDLLEIYEFRLGLEPVAAGLAAQRATVEEIAEMRRHLSEENSDLHRLIYRSARNRRISDALDAIHAHSQRLRQILNYPDQNFRMSGLQEHRDIVEAISRREAQLAEQCMREHILNGLRHGMAVMGNVLPERRQKGDGNGEAI